MPKLRIPVEVSFKSGRISKTKLPAGLTPAQEGLVKMFKPVISSFVKRRVAERYPDEEGTISVLVGLQEGAKTLGIELKIR